MNDKDLRKEKIRQRYKGINPDEINVIPAMPEEDFFDNKERRVAVYVRVSTDDPRQTSSYELQKNYYSDVIERHTGWKLVKIYADEGISGTSVAHRKAFLEMIKDCEDNKIDLIVTKSVSRFARNVVDCIGYVRKLAAMNPPVFVYFEAENLFTYKNDIDNLLSWQSTMAQEESRVKSNIMNASIEMRFGRGIFLTPPLLGYDKDEDGNLIINESEASIVRLIFFMYLYGYTCNQIAQTLTRLSCKTKKENVKWHPGSILNILQNERYYGAVLARKTWTPNYLDHKSKKNKRNRNQYLYEDNHEAIISRDDFIAVQRFINNAKYGNKRILPELKIIKQGALAGFVTIHPHWAGFKAKDYILASQSVQNTESSITNKLEIELPEGEFDFRGYEIARTQFFNTSGKTFMTVSNKNISFSSGCIHRFNDMEYVEMLIFPEKHLFAVRSSDKDKNLSVKWAKRANGIIVPRTVSGAAFINTIYEIFGWNSAWKYRVQGTYYCRDNMPVIIFDMNDTETLISDNSSTIDIESLSSSGKSVIGYPVEWIDDFGDVFYTRAQAKELENFLRSGKWNVDDEGEPFHNDSMPHILDKEEIDKNINDEIDKIKKGGKDG